MGAGRRWRGGGGGRYRQPKNQLSKTPFSSIFSVIQKFMHGKKETFLCEHASIIRNVLLCKHRPIKADESFRQSLKRMSKDQSFIESKAKTDKTANICKLSQSFYVLVSCLTTYGAYLSGISSYDAQPKVYDNIN